MTFVWSNLDMKYCICLHTDGDTLYVLVDYFEGRDLAKKIQAKRESGEQFTEEEVLYL